VIRDWGGRNEESEVEVSKGGERGKVKKMEISPNVTLSLRCSYRAEAMSS
jgi:hypothetical protein